MLLTLLIFTENLNLFYIDLPKFKKIKIKYINNKKLKFN